MNNRIGSSETGTNGRTGAPAAGPRADYGADRNPLRELANFALRNRAMVFGVPALVVVATLVFVFWVTPIYDGATWIRIDEDQSSLPVLDALQSLSAGDQIQTELAVLQRRPLAERVVDTLGLQLAVTDPERVPRATLLEDVAVERDAPPGEYTLEREGDGFRVTGEGLPTPVDAAVGPLVALPGVRFRLTPEALEHPEIDLEVRAFHPAVRQFRKTLQVTQPGREADLLRIRYHGTDPVQVRDVPNTLAALFIRQRQEYQKTEANSTVDFLRDQINTLSGQLAAAEDELRAFREANNIVSLQEEGEAQVGRFAELQAEHNALDTEREALAGMLEEVAQEAESDDAGEGPSPYRSLLAFPSLLANQTVSELFRSLAELETERSQLLNLRRPADPDVQVLTERIEELERQLRDIAVNYLNGLNKQVASLDRVLGEFRRDLSEVPAKEVQYARLYRQAQVLDEIYTLLQTRLKEAEIVAAVEDPSVRIVEPAQLPLEPIRPNKPLSLVLGLLAGLALGAGLAFLRENMDTSVHTREDLQDVAPGVPILGLIPQIPEAAGNGRPEPVYASKATEELAHRLVAGRDPRSPISEAYRSMRTNISFSALDDPHQTLVFTSALPGDGKSTTASNLAITLVQQGLKALLVDADLRRGVLHQVFGEPRQPGLSNVLIGSADLESAIRQVHLGESGTIDFLPAGSPPPNPAELIGSDQARALIERLESRYDMVVVDAPPLNLVTDAALLATVADGIVIVARSGVTDRGAIVYALEQVAAVRAPVLGMVLNDIDVRKDRYYGSYGLASYERYAAQASSD
jgi:tyrosine-protein kinase Etk/Wzc